MCDFYQVVSTGQPDELGKKVSDYLCRGWRLYGDLVATANGSGVIQYIQVVVK